MFRSVFLLAALFVLSVAGLQAQQLSKGQWDDLQNQIKASKTFTVVNFWATWCKPCVAEMPHFQEVVDDYADQDVNLLFVSADDPEYYDQTLPAFIQRKSIRYPVFLMDDTNPNNWVPKVNPDWQGDLPATLIIDEMGNFVGFKNGSLSAEELKDFIDKCMKIDF